MVEFVIYLAQFNDPVFCLFFSFVFVSPFRSKQYAGKLTISLLDLENAHVQMSRTCTYHMEDKMSSQCVWTLK